MAPRSPTHAFDPTPALEQNPYNYSPFNKRSESVDSDMLSFDTYRSGLHKEVRFSEQPAGPFYRAHSIATENVPLLPAVASASTIPKTSFRITNPIPGIDITAYIENCRNLNEQLRQAHEAERRAWNIERTALKSRIADLEFKLNKSSDRSRRSSNESHHNNHAPKPDFRALYQSKNSVIHRPATDSVVPTVAPVWKGPEMTPPATRVFQTEETNGHHLPSISEDETFPSLSKEVSPNTTIDNESVPIEKVDSTLDGITLRSAALTSSFKPNITSPQFGSPSDSPVPQQADGEPDHKTLHIDPTTLLSPLDEKLKRHAGHTPMAFDGEVSVVPSDLPTEIPTPLAENPPAPAPTKRPPLRPSENSDSYFSVASDIDIKETIKEEAKRETIAEADESQPQLETEDDKPLKGPLMLDPSARTQAASAFLEKLDAKLEAVREASPDRRQSFVSTSTANDAPQEVPAQPVQSAQPEMDNKPEPDDDMPKLKLKKSTNFGSAYGFSMPGWK